MTNLFPANSQIRSYDTRHPDDRVNHRDLDNTHWPTKGPNIWNSIDSKTHKIKSLHLFKRKMKSNIIDKTAVANYPRKKNAH